jgi:hypothetical protein
MKTTKKSFESFKKYCREYQKEFGLMHYTLYFELGECEGFAHNNVGDMYVATITLNHKYNKEDYADSTHEECLKDTARHEMLHVIIGKLYYLAFRRHASSSEILSADEEAVSIMENLLGEVK